MFQKKGNLMRIVISVNYRYYYNHICSILMLFYIVFIVKIYMYTVNNILYHQTDAFYSISYIFQIY